MIALIILIITYTAAQIGTPISANSTKQARGSNMPTSKPVDNDRKNPILPKIIINIQKLTFLKFGLGTSLGLSIGIQDPLPILGECYDESKEHRHSE